MSRISDAIRKAEEERGASYFTATTTTPTRTPAQGPGSKRDTRPAIGFEEVESIRPHITPDKHILAFADGHAPGTEKFRMLRHRLRKIRADQPLGKLMVSSPVPGEGKTLVAVNLAFSLSKLSSRVVLVDADLRHPGVHEVLGLQPMNGLAEYLQEKIDEKQAIRRIEPWNFYYMPAGNCPENPGELLHGGRIGELLNKLGEVFDWVIVDTAPITLFADTPQLANFVDGTLLVARLGVTPPDALERAVLAMEGNYIAGIVLNGATENSSDYGGYYYGHYAHKSGEDADADLDAVVDKKAEEVEE